MSRKRRLKVRKRFWLLLALLLLAVAAALAGVYLRRQPAATPKVPVVNVYFFQAAKLVAVERPLTGIAAPLQQAIEQLLAGPTTGEAAAGLSTLIPRGTRALHLRVKNGVAIIDFNRKLEAYGGGSARIEGMIAQIVFTATALPGAEKAWIWMEGEKELVLGGEGLVLDKPLSRSELTY